MPNNLPEPNTRKEKFLASAAGMAVETPTPIIREEMYLDAIAKGSGGGTGDSYTKAETDELLSKKPGEITTGKQYTIDGQTVTAGTGAEAFNNLTNNKASGEYSHAEGTATTAFGASSHAEGASTKAFGKCSHAEGAATTASESQSHAEGMITTASGAQSHAEGQGTTAAGSQSHAEGSGTRASGQGSHAEGAGTMAFGANSHAEGMATTASGAQSHAEGIGTNASSLSQHAQGKYNVVDTNNKFAFIIGNGTKDNARHNAFAVDWNGLIYVNGAATGVDVSALDPSNLSPAVPVAKGGTGATSASSARSNLGLGDASTYSVTSIVTSGSSSLVTSGAVYSTLFPRTATISAEANITISYQDTAFISNVFIFNITVKSSSAISSGSSVPLLSFGLGTLSHTNSRAITCTAGDIPQRAWYNGADGKIYMKPTNSVTADSPIFLSGMIVV